MLIDSHCHLDVEAFDADRTQVLRHCRALGVTELVVPAISADGWDRLLALAASEAGIHPALGLHPMFLERHGTDDIRRLADYLARHDTVVAIGEIGLDFYLPEADRAAQLQLFQAQLVLAVNVGKPVILHVRKAHDEALACLRRQRVCGGIVHAFSGSAQQARQYIELGFVLGFGGTLSYERAQRVRRLAQQLPLEAMALETDAPDMPLATHPGRRNSPEYLPEILTVLADLRGQSARDIALQTAENVRRVLRLW